MAVDLLIKGLCRRRPYERRKGLADRAHAENLKDIENGLASGALKAALKRCRERLASIEFDKDDRPLVGIAGDIYTRQNAFANNGLARKLEDMGCEVWPAPMFVDGADFTLEKTFSTAMKRRRFPQAVGSALLNARKDVEARRVRNRLKEALPRSFEPDYKEVLRYAAPYVAEDVIEVLLLNVAKMVDFAHRGAQGVVNCICFNCMLGTVSGALAERIRKDYDGIPIPTLVFSGSETPQEAARLEAFVYQVISRSSSVRRSGRSSWACRKRPGADPQ